MIRHLTLAALALAGCSTAPAVTKTLRPETRPECVSLCGEMGMRLAAVVLIRDSAGCVCEPIDAAPGAQAAPRASASGAAAAAGGAVVLAMEEEEQARRKKDEDDRRRRDDDDRRLQGLRSQ